MDRVGGEHTMIYQAPKDKFIWGVWRLGWVGCFFLFGKKEDFYHLSISIYFCTAPLLRGWVCGVVVVDYSLIVIFFFSEEVSLGSWFKHTIIKYNHTLPMHQSHNYLTCTTHQILRHSL